MVEAIAVLESQDDAARGFVIDAGRSGAHERKRAGAAIAAARTGAEDQAALERPGAHVATFVG